MSGHVKALPFTGLATIPLAVLGLVVTGTGIVMTKIRPHKSVG